MIASLTLSLLCRSSTPLGLEAVMRIRLRLRAFACVLATLAALCAHFPGARVAHARSAARLLIEQSSPSASSRDGAARTQTPARSDTVWFGGYDEAEGIAYNSADDGYSTAVWTWDAATEDSLEGWTTIDATQDPRVFFAWVNADSFGEPAHPGDPADEHMIFPPVQTNGQVWVGAHEDEAIKMGWATGMGYGNDWCQKAYSPAYNISPGQEIHITFEYFVDSEVDFDYAYVHVLSYDAGNELLQTYEAWRFCGDIGTAAAPANSNMSVPYTSFTPAPAKVRLQFTFDADGAWSDEDGDYSCNYGPFAADDVDFRIGNIDHIYDFEGDPDGWTFERCPGIGTYMNICTEAEWSTWVLGPPAVRCPCDLSGNALNCATDLPYLPRPGHFPHHHELMASPVIDRERFTSAAGYHDVVARWDAFNFLRIAAVTFWRPGFYCFPFATAEDPNPRWSPRTGQEVWKYSGQTPICEHNVLVNLSAPPDGTPLPADWQNLRYCFEILTECEMYGLEIECKKEGMTNGAPVYDNVRVGITGGVDAPPIVLETGHLFHDGFGQTLPEHLDAGDVCNANVAFDLSRDSNYPDYNDWLADTAIVRGPPVRFPEDRYWIDLCFRIARKGPRQEMIPAYSAWKARLAGNPEAGFVCCLLDTAMTVSHGHEVPWNGGQARVTYFHENDPGFDPSHADRSPEQEILPDLAFTPGTRVEYYYRGYWATHPAGYFTLPAGAPAEFYEFECLPAMEPNTATPEEYDVVWPSILYVAADQEAETAIVPLLNQLGLAFDKYDRQDFASSYDAALRRSFGGGCYNPGGWGNNGCTLEQLLGYRLILFNTGSYGVGAGEDPDFTLLEDWLTTTECGLPSLRRGLIMNGDELAEIMGHPQEGRAIPFCRDVLGVSLTDHAYRDYNSDEYSCVWLSPTDGNEFDPSQQISVYDNGCPGILDFNVIGPYAGTGSIGNLKYVPGSGATTPLYPEVNYAQVVRENLVAPGDAGGWKTVVDGFSWHHLSEVYYGGQECGREPCAILEGMLDLAEPEFAWLGDGGAAPFVKWRFPCANSAAPDEPETHLGGPVNFLYPSRPNPFRGSATLRFTLAKEGPVEVRIYDVGGRLIRTLHDGKAPAGESTMVWDGADDAGRRVNGIFWVEMSADGYRSTKRLAAIR